jgi:CheY-like chemotaxis protein
VLVDGYEVVAAGQVEEGLRMVAAERPDLILVDLDLPGADPAQLRGEVAAVLQRRPALVDHPA